MRVEKISKTLRVCPSRKISFMYLQIVSVKLITPSVVSERLKVRASLAKAGLQELLNAGLIKCVVKHGSQLVYTRASKAEGAVAE